jgi:hypothetical protein
MHFKKQEKISELKKWRYYGKVLYHKKYQYFFTNSSVQICELKNGSNRWKVRLIELNENKNYKTIQRIMGEI